MPLRITVESHRSLENTCIYNTRATYIKIARKCRRLPHKIHALALAGSQAPLCTAQVPCLPYTAAQAPYLPDAQAPYFPPSHRNCLSGTTFAAQALYLPDTVRDRTQALYRFATQAPDLPPRHHICCRDTILLPLHHCICRIDAVSTASTL